jgi:hypothetical protein
MKNKNRLFIYILINILISALTILTILWLWERSHPRPEINLTTNGQIQTPGATSAGTSNDKDASEKELTEFDENNIAVTIYTVVGVGNYDVEYVEVRNYSSGAVDPTGWALKDEDGNVFTFPASPGLVLNSGGAIKILTKKGNNSVIELFWQSDAPIWQSGEIATLFDADGTIISAYSIP